MIDDKILNAFEYFHASSTFSIFLIDNEFDRFDPTYLDQNDKEVYVKLLVTHSALLLALFKEEIMTKDDSRNISLNIFEKAFDALVSNLYQEDGDKYKIGDMSFDSKKELFDLIRNKLLHGDYVIDLNGYKVILNDKGITGSIEIIDLVETCKALCSSQECKLSEENKRTMTITKKSILESGPNLFNQSQLKKYMKDVYVIVFADKPMEGFQRDSKYAHTLASYYKTIQESKEYYEKHSIKNAVEILHRICLPYLRDAHIDLSYEIMPATQIEEFNRVKKYYLANRLFLDNLDNVSRRIYMNQVVSNIIYAKYTDYSVIAAALLNNISMLAAYVSDVPFSEIKYIELASNTYIDDMSIAAVFAQFYACYHYELDEIYSNGVGTSLKDVANGTYLDFSRLDLEGLYDEGMTIDNGFNDFSNQLERLEKSLEKISTRKEGAETAYRNYLAKCKNPKADAESRLLANIEALINEYNDAYTTYEQAQEFMNSRYDKYVKNYNIISHIRNAFAHGNVRIMHHTSGDTLNDRVLVIEDNYEGVNTFKLVITYKEFDILFRQDNLDLIYNFIRSKVETIAKNKGLIYRPE